jgi:hypothetical protein
MRIEMSKIGRKLDSRPSGREAFLALQPTLRSLKDDDTLVLDFSNVDLLTPSFADEFVTPLIERYGNRVQLTQTHGNASVRESLAFLAEDWPERSTTAP